MRLVIIIFLAIATGIMSFLYYSRIIQSNLINVNTDEFYWISSGKNIQLIFNRDWHNPLWYEDWGFTNFNGAKFVYGTGLTLLGYNNFDWPGHGSETYYNWIDFSGKPFPVTHPYYPMLRDSRLIAAFWTSLGIGFFFILCVVISDSIFAGIIGSILLGVHPIILNVSTHSLSDNIIFVFEILSVLAFSRLILLLFSHRHRHILLISLINGIIIGTAVSVKINLAFLYVNIICLSGLVIFGKNDKSAISDRFRLFLSILLILTISSVTMFLLLNPNIFFYPGYPFQQMITDRINITKYHMMYFSNIPGHVLWTIPERLLSLQKNIFTYMTTPFFLIGFAATLIHFFRTVSKFIQSFYGIIVVFGMMMFFETLYYVVFDENRYFLPLLPFIIIISVYYLNIFKSGRIIRHFLSDGIAVLRQSEWK